MYDRKKVIDIALAEDGYIEKASNALLDNKTANPGNGNFTKYARDLDNISGFYNGKKNGFAWCDIFLDWCFVQAYGAEQAKALLCQPDYSAGAGCIFSAQYFKSKGQFYSSPEIGDQIFFGNASDCYHTGLVYDVDSVRVYTIEGNTGSASGVVANGGCVRKKSYPRTYSEIYGYGRPNYADGFIPDKKTDTQTETIPNLSTDSVKINGLIDTVREVQYWLNQNYSSGLNPDGLYGSLTKSALIKALQKECGLESTGTWNDALYKACSRLDLHKGNTGRAVEILQACLVCNGYKTGYVDGDFGIGTRLALLQYQKKHGLDADGIAGQNTFRSLMN